MTGKPLTEAEEFMAAAEQLGIKLDKEDVQRRVIASKGKAAAEGLTYDQWKRRNLVRWLTEDDES